MAEETGGEKTLPASPLKRQKARDRGHVAKSQDLNAAGTLAAALLALWILGRPMWEQVVGVSRYYFMNAAHLPVDPGSIHPFSFGVVGQVGWSVLPFMILLLMAGLTMNVIQVGILFAPEALKPHPERLNPVTGMKKFFTVRTFVELMKSLAKLTLIGLVVYVTLRARWERVLILSQLSLPAIVKTLSGLVFVLWFRVVLVMLAIGLLDYAFQRWQYEQDLRMTVQEAREELKELEGDPRIRQRVRQIQRQMAMQRMMAEVPKADVVITNPVRYAVALRYDLSTMEAPVLTAKGARLLAQRIRELAVRHDVPIVEKPELARAIFRTVEVGQPVPESLYRAVAEVLRFVYQIDRRAEKVRERESFLASLRETAA